MGLIPFDGHDSYKLLELMVPQAFVKGARSSTSILCKHVIVRNYNVNELLEEFVGTWKFGLELILYVVYCMWYDVLALALLGPSHDIWLDSYTNLTHTPSTWRIKSLMENQATFLAQAQQVQQIKRIRLHLKPKQFCANRILRYGCKWIPKMLDMLCMHNYIVKMNDSHQYLT